MGSGSVRREYVMFAVVGVGVVLLTTFGASSMLASTPAGQPPVEETNGTVNGKVLAPDGTPAAGDGIIVFVEEGGTVGDSESAVTDENGTFSVGVPEGEQFDVAFYQEYPRGDPPFPADDVPDVYALARVDEPTDLGTVELPEAHPVEVVVEDEQGEPVEGATVTVEHRRDGATAALAGIRTDDEGRIQLPDGATLDLTGQVTIRVRRPAGDDRFVDNPQVEEVTITNSTTVTVVLPSPTSPDAVAKGPGTVAAGDGVLLDASNSTDPDGGWLKYDWEQVGGPDVNLNTSNTTAATFVAPDTDEPVELTFEVRVTDRYGLSDTATVSVTVNPNEEDQVTRPMRMETTPDDGSVIVTVIHGKAGDRGSIDLPPWNRSVGPTEVGVTLDADVKIGSITVTPTGNPPEGVDALDGASGYVSVEGIGIDDDDLDSLTLRVPVENVDGTPVVYVWEENGWTEVDTTVVEGNLTVTLDGPGTIALAIEREPTATPTRTRTRSATPKQTSTPGRTSTATDATTSTTGAASPGETPKEGDTPTEGATPTEGETGVGASGFGIAVAMAALVVTILVFRLQ